MLQLARLRAVRSVSGVLRQLGRERLLGRWMAEAQSEHWSMQWYPLQVVTERQWNRLSQLVKYAHDENEFYRERLRDVYVDSHFTPEAFRRIPPLDRATLMSSWERVATTSPTISARRLSGGTSGFSVPVRLDITAYCWYLATLWRGLRWWGVDLWEERGVVLLGPSSGGMQDLGIRAKDWLINWLRIPVNARFNVQAPHVLDRITAFGPAYLYGYPSAVDRLARIARQRGWRPRAKPKVIVLTGEPAYEFQRRTIEEVFQCPVAEEYGSGELGCMAFQCPEGSLHITAENVFVETVRTDPSVGSEGGMILATQLRNHVFPLIRYETGDLGIVSTEPCRCQRGLPVVRVLGRARDRMVGTQDVVLARPQLEQFMNMLPCDLQGHVQVAHGEPGRIVLYVERGHERSLGALQLAAVGTEVFGTDWDIEVLELEQLTRLRSGKLPYFVRLGGGG